MSKFFINRPIVAMVISILMVILGLVAMTRLPIAQFPNIVPPAIQVNATYTGADALTVEQSVATPIEQQMSGVDNLDYMYSINANNGMMTLYNYFELGTNANTDQILAQMRGRAGRVAAAAGCRQLRGDGGKIHLVAADHVRPLLPQRAPTTTSSSPTTPTSTSTTR